VVAWFWVAGASDLVDRKIASTLLTDPTADVIHTLGRRPLAIKHPKLRGGSLGLCLAHKLRRLIPANYRVIPAKDVDHAPIRAVQSAKPGGATLICTAGIRARSERSAIMVDALIILRMRINLVTPFAEKDAVKALGARWDAAKKLWYIVDVTDLTPFARWIPDIQAAMKDATDGVKPALKNTSKTRVDQFQGLTTGAANKVPHCGCNVHPWEDCVHTASSMVP